MTIGELARKAGVGVETVRYYQRRGLFPEPARQPRSTREYQSMSPRLKRGALARRFEILAHLRVLLRAEVTPERMLRSVAAMLAQYFDFCVADIVDAQGDLRRIAIAHADPSRREQLRVLANETLHPPQGRVATLVAEGGTEHIARVTAAARARSLPDLAHLDERIASEMAVAISVGGAPMAVLTILSTSRGRAIDANDVHFMKCVAEWTALGLENAVRRHLQPRTSVAPPPPSYAPPAPEVRRLVTRR